MGQDWRLRCGHFCLIYRHIHIMCSFALNLISFHVLFRNIFLYFIARGYRIEYVTNYEEGREHQNQIFRINFPYNFHFFIWDFLYDVSLSVWKEIEWNSIRNFTWKKLMKFQWEKFLISQKVARNLNHHNSNKKSNPAYPKKNWSTMFILISLSYINHTKM